MLFRKIPRVVKSVTADQIMARRVTNCRNSVTSERDILKEPFLNVLVCLLIRILYFVLNSSRSQANKLNAEDLKSLNARRWPWGKTNCSRAPRSLSRARIAHALGEK